MKKMLKSLVAFSVVFTISCSSGQSQPRMKNTEENSLKLIPKLTMKREDAVWTHAPSVPPPINRREPRVLEVNWRIKETAKEIAPGVHYQTYWTFEGQVPGPMLRGRVGDVFRIKLTNDTANLHSHNIDFHFVTGTGGGAETLNTGPGNTSVAEFRAMAPGFYMYHCATADIPTHISNGMYGFVLIEPEEGLPRVDHEFYIVQSEFYPFDNKPGEQFISLENLTNEHPQFVVFNGRQGSLTGDNALHVFKGKKVRMYVGNAGLNLASNFHVIGEIFDKVYREGDLVSPPARFVQTTLIPAGGASVVEFTPDVPGSYILVDHALVRAIYKGAVGILKVSGSYEQAEREIFESLKNGSANLARPEENKASGGHSQEGHTMTPENPAEKQGEEKKPVKTEPVKPEPAKPATKTDVKAQQASVPPGAYVVTGNFVKIEVLPTPRLSRPHVIIQPGTEVMFQNSDPGGVHSMQEIRRKFQRVDLPRTGASGIVKFTEKGIYEYYCDPHTWLKGIIEVR